MANQSSHTHTYIEEAGKRQSSFVPSANLLDASIHQSADLKGGAPPQAPQQKVSIMQHTYNNKVPLQKSLKAKKTQQFIIGDTQRVPSHLEHLLTNKRQSGSIDHVQRSTASQVTSAHIINNRGQGRPAPETGASQSVKQLQPLPLSQQNLLVSSGTNIVAGNPYAGFGNAMGRSQNESMMRGHKKKTSSHSQSALNKLSS